MDTTEIVRNISTEGYAVVQTDISNSILTSMRSELINAIEAEDRWHGSQNHVDQSMVLVCPLYSTMFNSILEDQTIWQATSELLGDNAIVYAFTSSSMPPTSTNYSHRIHNDCPRQIPDYLTNVGLTFPLDPFSLDNGATYVLPGSHRWVEPPTESQFTAGAERFVAEPGTALLFDARLWHSGGLNQTPHWRHSLTVNFCRSWMKQRVDLPRLLGAGYRSQISERAAQRLGYWSQVPASYYEYYQPAHRRLYAHPAE